MNNFIAYNNIGDKPNTWIPDDLMYGQTKIGGFNMFKINNFF